MAISVKEQVYRLIPLYEMNGYGWPGAALGKGYKPLFGQLYDMIFVSLSRFL